MNAIELGALIRKKRKELGLTLSDIANEHISVPTISNIERGIVHSISEEKLSYIKERLGLSDEELARMKEDSKETQRVLTEHLETAKHLIKMGMGDSARKELAVLEGTDKLRDHPYFFVATELLKGSLYYKLSQWDRAKRSLTNALRLFKEEGIDPQTNLEAEVYHFLSLCAFYGDQDYEQAIEQVDIALAAFQEGGDLAHLPGQMLYDKANYFFHLERYAPAYKYVAEAQKACEQTGDIRMLILSYNLEGLVFKRQRMHDRAIRCFRKAIRMSEAYHPDWQLASILYLNLGDTYYHQQKYDKSLHAFDIVNELCPRTKDDNVRATLYISYGEVFYKQQEYEKAAEYVNRATNFAKKIRLTSEYLQLLILKANIALETDSDEVEELCREGIDLADKRMLPDKKKEFLFIMAKWKVAKVTGAPLIELQ